MTKTTQGKDARNLRTIFNSRSMEYQKSFIKRFWSKIDKSDGCWEWTAGKSGGYGVISFTDGDSYGQMLKANRVSQFIHRNGIPINGQVNHTCGNKGCVNPDHLYVGDARDNNVDMYLDKDDELQASLEEADEIRQMYDNTSKTHAEIGEQFGIRAHYVGKIVRGEKRNIGGDY